MVARSGKNYKDYGVVISPTNPNVGDKVKILYDGILAKSGAKEVYAHIGYGQTFENVTDIKMVPTSMGFEATIPALKSNTLNVCFKDSANNWDNNSGGNYLFDIE